MTTKRLSRLEFRKDAWDKVALYIKGVEEGTIITNEYIKEIITWFKPTSEYEIKIGSVDKVFDFLSFLNIDNGTEYSQIRLELWEAYAIANVFGVYERNTNIRRYNTFALFIAKKNGKTAFAAMLILYLLYGKEQLNPQILLMASKEKQALIPLMDCKKIIMHTPFLQELAVIHSKSIALNEDEMNDIGVCMTLGANSTVNIESNDGFKVSAAILDECHTYDNEERYKIVKNGTSSRDNALIIMTSTAGKKTTGFLNEMLTYWKRVIKGEIKDNTVFPMIFSPDEKEVDITDKNLWLKSNPSLGTIKKMSVMEGFYNEAVNRPSARIDFLTKHLNIFYRSGEGAFKERDLLRAARKVDEAKWLGKKCWVGLDLSATTDLSAIVCLFKEEMEENGIKKEKWESIPYFFMVNDIDKLNRKSGLDLRPWIEPGYIKMCSGETIDYDLIISKLQEIKEKFKVQGIGYDNWNFKFIKMKVLRMGFTIQEVSQLAKGQSEPLKLVEKLLIDGDLSISDNPAALWNWRNVRVQVVDTKNNIHINKNESEDSVDGAVALNNAMSLYFSQVLEPMAPAK